MFNIIKHNIYVIFISMLLYCIVCRLNGILALVVSKFEREDRPFLVSVTMQVSNSDI